MGENCCPRYSKYVVYFIIFCDLAGGVAYLLYGLSRFSNDPLEDIINPSRKVIAAATIPTAILSIVMGTLLLLGVRQNNEKYVFIHVIISTAILTHSTIFIIIFTEVQEMDVGPIFGNVILFTILWSIQYVVYLYYKEMVKSNASSVYAGDTVITYNERNENQFIGGTTVAEFDNTAV